MTEAAVFEFTDYDGLVAAMRRLIVARGLTYEAIDALAGFQPGYTAKLLGPRQTRKFGAMSLDVMLSTLAGKLTLTDDVDRLEKMSVRYETRVRPRRMLANASTKRATWLMGPRQARANGRKRWAKCTSKRRASHARKMSNARWKKYRKRRLMRLRKRREALAALKMQALCASQICASE